MKKTVKRLLAGSAAAAAAAVVWKNRESPKLEPVFDQAKKCLYRANSLVMDTAIKLIPGLFPLPRTEIGCGSRKLLPQVLKELGISHVMVVTGPSIGKRLVPPIVEDLENQGIACTVFSETEANPSVTTVESIRSLYLDAGCDGFLAIGGGSPMDAAKVAAARIAKPHTPIGKMAGTLRVLAKLPPVVCVPTTAGTGSEVSVGAVISDRDEQHKYAITDPCLTPKAAVIDPELTVSVPPFVTATTGIDALTHAVESYVTWAYRSEFTDRCCEEAVVGIFRYLDRAYENGEDLEAREQMSIAACKAGLAFTRTGLGYVHAIAHTLGGLYNVPHGLANAVILPIVLEDYGEAVHPRLARLAEITGIQTEGTEAEKAGAFIAAIRAMNSRMGLPAGFDFIRREDFDRICKWALAEANMTYPVPVIYNKARCEQVLERILREATPEQQ